MEGLRLHTRDIFSCLRILPFKDRDAWDISYVLYTVESFNIFGLNGYKNRRPSQKKRFIFERLLVAGMEDELSKLDFKHDSFLALNNLWAVPWFNHFMQHVRHIKAYQNAIKASPTHTYLQIDYRKWWWAVWKDHFECKEQF